MGETIGQDAQQSSEAGPLGLPTPHAETRAPQGTVLVLRKAVAILRAFTQEEAVLTLPDLRAKTGLPMTTCQRIVSNLVAERILERTDDTYRIGWSVLQWAAIARQARPLNQVLSTVLRELRDTTEETACGFVVQGRLRVCVEVIPTNLPVRPQTYVGQAVPLHVGAAGKVILAYNDDLRLAAELEGLERLTTHTITDPVKLDLELKRVCSQGWSISAEEVTSGLAGVAAPVFDADRRVVASVALSIPLQRARRQRLRSLVPSVLDAAARASDRLGYRPKDT